MQYPLKFEKLTRNRLAILVALGALVLAGAVYALNRHQSVSESAQPVKTQIDLLGGQWSYMPGSSRVESGGLQIMDLDFKIVEQNGSGGQPNPPVNLYGTHAVANGAFQITAEMESIKEQASLQLYGGVPIIQDEFRVEPPSLRLNADPEKDEIRIDLWDGSTKPNLANQQPAIEKVYKLPLGKKIHWEITRRFGKLAIAANGKNLVTLPENGVFDSGEIWFGAEGQNGDYHLSSLVARPLYGSKISVVDSSKLHVQPGKEGLQQLASRRRPGFSVGAAMALSPSVSDRQYDQVAFGDNFGALTTENALKMQFVEPKAGIFDFHEADAMVDLAIRHGMKVHGHTLVFSEANPSWVSNLPTTTPQEKKYIEKVMTDYVTKTINRYNGSNPKIGRIDSWDVVDEPLGDDNQLRSNIWYQAMGPDYIAKAYRAAHQANPDAKLFINEYGLEMDGERWQAMLNLLDKLRSQNVPIYGVGFEAHVYERGDSIDPAILQKRFKDLDSRGLKYRVSEMDVYSDGGANVQANQYIGVFKLCFRSPNCIGFTTWGVSDRYDLWQDENHQLQHGQDLLWDKKMRPTPAEKAIENFLKSTN